MTQQEREWQHDGCADLDHNDPNRDVLMTPRPWPKLNGAQVMAIMFACGVLTPVAWWLVTKSERMAAMSDIKKQEDMLRQGISDAECPNCARLIFQNAEMKALNFDYLHQCNVATNCAMQGESKGEFLTQLEAHNRELARENAELKAQVERLIHDHDRHEYHPRGVGGCSICEASRKRIAARAGRK